MTITSVVHEATFTGNGVTTVFPFTFPFLDNSHIIVRLTSVAGVVTLQTLTTNYTLTGAGGPSGGSVTMLVAPATGVTVTVERLVPETQDTDLQNQGAYYAETVETALDKLTMLAQQNVSESELAAAVATAVAGLTVGSYNPVLATGSTTARTLQDRFAETFNVKDFGAIGDGIADDTVAIQAALNAVPDGTESGFGTPRGGEVRMPPGYYRVTGTLTLKARTRLIGAGSEATSIEYGSTTGDVLYYQRPNSPMSGQPPTCIKGLRIFMKVGVTHTSGAAIHIDSADPSGSGKAGRVVLDDLYVYQTFEGIRIRNMIGGEMHFCEAHYCGSSGFIFRGFCTLFDVSDCWSSGNTLHGWDISGFAYCHVSACGSDSNGGSGWLIKRQAGDGAMVGNTFDSLGAEGSITSQYTFENLQTTTVSCYGAASATATPSVDGIVLTNISDMRLTAYLASAVTATGYPLRVTDPTVSTGIQLHGGNIGAYANGTNRVLGVEAVSFVGFLSGNRYAFGGCIATNALPQWPFNVVSRTGVPGVAGVVLGDLRSVPTDGRGSTLLRLSADNGNSFAELHHNSLVGGPHTWGTFGSLTLHATSNFAGTAIQWAINNVLRAVLSALGFFTVSRFIGNGTAHVAGDYAASAGWGTTPTITPLARDTGGRVSVLAQATTGANPTLALTFTDGTWTTAPAVSSDRGDSLATAGRWALTTITATVATWTFVGTPVAGETYVLDFTVVGK